MNVLVTEPQLRKLERLMKRLPDKPYERELDMLKSYSHFLPGHFTITTSDPKTYARLQKLVRMILPEAVFTFESGRGWHSGDRTPYCYGHINLLLK